MAVEDGKAATAKAEGKAWGFCRFPFFGSGAGTGGGSASSSTTNSSTALSLTHRHHPRSSERSQLGQREGGAAERRSSGAGSVSSVARSLLPTRRRLRLDPSTKLYFPYLLYLALKIPNSDSDSYFLWSVMVDHLMLISYEKALYASVEEFRAESFEDGSFDLVKEKLILDSIRDLISTSIYEPGKQARSAVRIKNTSKAHVAFKFQTTAPKSCFMRPPGGILSPGESIIATVFKFVEQPENNEKPMEQKCNVKFKIISLKVNGPTEYIPELFDEQKDQVAVEQILQVVFLDPERSCSQMDKLKRQLAEAEAAIEARKKPPEDSGPRIIGEGLVIDEWKERRERYLAQQQVGGVDSV
ncbi:hypothetical protein ZIOFF_060397 [Zingiber officinale]|uniref:MSP domain-containing protein n=1 Tax=Zingiber officinale TaxID=94328 RepID=A0A8J5FCN4_ZINOF|nr:hypothetical protein ZIOFF_060397 [Zingiber officinale]